MATSAAISTLLSNAVTACLAKENLSSCENEQTVILARPAGEHIEEVSDISLSSEQSGSPRAFTKCIRYGISSIVEPNEPAGNMKVHLDHLANVIAVTLRKNAHTRWEKEVRVNFPSQGTGTIVVEVLAC